jgi:AcrR family transcriptional regulator
MGRNTNAPRHPPDVRRAALDAARQLFADRGFEGTAIQDVASAVGVTKQAVLHHFPSKAELREAVLAELLGHWGATLPRLLAEASGGYDGFQSVFGELVRFFCGGPSWARLVVRELLDRPEAARARLRSDVRPWIDAVAAYVRAGQRDGILRPDVDPEAWAVEMLQLTIFGAATHTVLAGAVAGRGEDRLALELTRIARSSLFQDRPPGGKGRRT